MHSPSLLLPKRLQIFFHGNLPRKIMVGGLFCWYRYIYASTACMWDNPKFPFIADRSIPRLLACCTS